MKAFFIAGELSGDKLGAALISGLRQLDPTLRLAGIGGPEMKERGLDSLFDMDELSVMGLAEVLPRYRHLTRRLKQTVEAVLREKPDVLITIDSPDFNLRVAKAVKARDASIRVVHYVAPSVWAWREGRAQKMAGAVDQVLALLPFEPPYMEAAGMRCDFVGHPVVAEPQATQAEAAAFRAESGIGGAPLVLVLPGSRRAEVSRLAPVFGEALRPVLARRPDTRVIVPAAAPVAGAVIEAVKRWPGHPTVIDPRGLSLSRAAARKRVAFRAADAAIAASGTVSLELAAADTPMVIAYDMNWVSWQIMSRMVKAPSVTLVNLVSETSAVPEFLGPACRPQPIAHALLDLLDHPEKQRPELAATMEALGRGGAAPGLRAAQAVIAGLEAQRGRATADAAPA
jgi:lipid-A-disaccharide synthase